MDTELVSRAQHDDQAAFAEIASALYARLHSLAHGILRDLYTEYREPLCSLGARPHHAVATLLWDARLALVTAVMAGFGRASAEVGAVLIVGGNIAHVTRVMTTTIALETSKGNLALALALGFILLLIAMGINACAVSLGGVSGYRRALA